MIVPLHLNRQQDAARSKTYTEEYFEMREILERGARLRENKSKPSFNLAIVTRQIEALKPDPSNPRRHSKKQIRQIAESVKSFGFVVPVLVDADLNVIAGHGRLLAQQLQELSVLGLDFSLEVTGFEMGEIDLRIASLDEMSTPDADPADAVPEVSAGPPVGKIDDLWLLDRHRVLCGNALDPEAFTALMVEERAAVVFTDPPYNVPIEGHASGLGTIHHRPFPMASGEMDKPAFTAFLGRACRNLATFSAGGSLHYVCTDWRHLDELL